MKYPTLFAVVTLVAMPLLAAEPPPRPGDVVPITSYQYQDIGVATRLEGRIVADGRIRVHGQAEVSSVDNGASPAQTGPFAPAVGTFDHEFEVILEDGVESTLVEVPSPDSGSIGLRLAAQIDGRRR